MRTSVAQELVSLILLMLFKTLVVSGLIDPNKSQTKPRDRELNLPTVGEQQKLTQKNAWIAVVKTGSLMKFKRSLYIMSS